MSLSRTARTIIATAAGAAALVAPAHLADAQPTSASPPPRADVRPFTVDVPQAALDDLRRRIAATRWPDKETVADRSQGARLSDLQDLVRYWGSDYDWRKAEATLNALPQFITNIDGVDVHFIHVRSRAANALPLIVTHGWPGSVIEQLKIIGPLVDPAGHGGRGEDAFDVVIPSIPGFGFSGKPAAAGWNPDRIARAWGTLMTRLGYSRYVAQGGDWGAPITSAMGRQAPPGLVGIHISLPASIPPEIGGALATGGPAPAALEGKERAAYDALNAFAKRDRAYVAMMGTRPQTVGYAASDSPAGLAAWLLVHTGFNGWSYGADRDQLPTRDDVLDNATLYWLTNSAASAARIYYENGPRNLLSPSDQMTADIAVPVAVTAFPDEIYSAPESWVRRAYPTLVYFHEAEKGGHFAAWEQPEVFAAEMRAAFTSIR